MFVTSFVKKNLVNAHKVLVKRLVEMAHGAERRKYNASLLGLSPTSPGFPASLSSRGSLGRHGNQESQGFLPSYQDVGDGETRSYPGLREANRRSQLKIKEVSRTELPASGAEKRTREPAELPG